MADVNRLRFLAMFCVSGYDAPMLIGHLPAGFVLTTWLQKRVQTTRFLWVGLVASVLPDIDLVYFYLVDHRQTLHHEYWTHLPFFWLVLLVLSFALCATLKKALLPAVLFFYANIFLHLVLDTVVGKIAWLYPLTETPFYFFEVPARYGWWVWNFVLHWTFGLEVLVLIWAGVVLLRMRPFKRRSG